MNHRTITIPAGSSSSPGCLSVPVKGKVFGCISCTADFQVAPDDGNKVSIANGRGFGDPNADQFSKLVFFNTSTANTVTFYAGDQAFVNAGFQTPGRNQRMYTGPWATFHDCDSYLITGTQPIGTALGNQIPNTQKRVVIYNTHATQALGLFDFTTGNQMARILAKTHLDFNLPAVGDFAISLDPASAGPITANVVTEYYNDAGALGGYWGTL